MSLRRPQIKVGCCGFATAQTLYFENFSCVEIDSSFYQLPKIVTAARWREAAPANFEFAIKAWQVITHRASSPTYKRTRLNEGDREHCGHFGFNPTIRWAWNETFAVAKALGATVVLFQCAASFRPTKDNLARLRSFFERAKRASFHMAWEPRGEWDAELVASLCKELDLIPVVDPLKTKPIPVGKVRYLRLHGTTGPRHRYTGEELESLRATCTGSRSTVYCLFNNLAMTEDGKRFQKLIAAH